MTPTGSDSADVSKLPDLLCRIKLNKERVTEQLLGELCRSGLGVVPQALEQLVGSVISGSLIRLLFQKFCLVPGQSFSYFLLSRSAFLGCFAPVLTLSPANAARDACAALARSDWILSYQAVDALIVLRAFGMLDDVCLRFVDQSSNYLWWYSSLPDSDNLWEARLFSFLLSVTQVSSDGTTRPATSPGA